MLSQIRGQHSLESTFPVPSTEVNDTFPVCPVQVINLSPNAPTELESSPAHTQNSFIQVGVFFLPYCLGDVWFHSITRGLRHYYYCLRGRVLSISG